MSWTHWNQSFEKNRRPRPAGRGCAAAAAPALAPAIAPPPSGLRPASGPPNLRQLNPSLRMPELVSTQFHEPKFSIYDS